VHGARLDWKPSPMPGVERRMLECGAGAKACARLQQDRATSRVHKPYGKSAAAWRTIAQGQGPATELAFWR
jgi:hypothetical protein